MTDTLTRRLDQLERDIIDSDLDTPDKALALYLVEQLRALVTPPSEGSPK